MLEKICTELGVEIGKTWLGSDGYYYCISESGQIEVLNKDDELLNYGYVYWEDIFTGKLKPVWKPGCGEDYSFPDTAEEKLYRSRLWGGFKDEKMLLERGLVFKTKEEAIAAANKMLKAIKEDN